MSDQVELEKAIKERELELKKMAEKLSEFNNTYHDVAPIFQAAFRAEYDPTEENSRDV